MSEEDSSQQKTERVSLRIQGMHCAACVAKIEKALIQQKGVLQASVNLLDQKAIVEISPDEADREVLEQAVESTGYTVKRARMGLTLIPAPHETDWTQITQALKNLSGVISLSTFPASAKVLIEYDEDLITLKIIQRQLQNLGFDIGQKSITDIDHETLTRKREIQYYSRLFSLALIFTIPVVIFTFLPQLILPFLPLGFTPDLLNFLLTTPVQFIAGYPFYKSSLKAARHRTTNMDTLIMVGTSAAYFYSVAATFLLPGMTFFDSAAMLITFILLGRTLESIAKGRTSRAIRSLMDLQPQVALVLRDGEEITIPAEDVEVNDILLIKPGEKIPIDGIVLAGESTVDESMITGESIPIQKVTGNSVIGATLNQKGVLRIRATKVGQDTVLSQIIRLVEEAQTQKPPIQRKADAIASVFVPFVLLITFLTFIGWLFFAPLFFPPSPPVWVHALNFAIAVVVAACPCALGLATPTALMVGLGKGAQHGLLFKGGSGLETIPQIDTIVFDKTGTLTIGKPTLTDVIPVESVELDDVLKIVAAVEKNSEHPLATAIVQAAEKRDLVLPPVTDFISIPGKGVEGKVDGKHVILGTSRYLAENGINLEVLLPHSKILQEAGKTIVFAAINGNPFALLAIADTLKEHSPHAVHQLTQQGIDVIMLTGDKVVTAQAIAQNLGISQVLAEVLPGDKAEEIRRLQSEGHIVAMVGDGVNDAPALAQADVGIALGSGTDVSVETGDIVLVKDNLLDVVAAINLGKKTVAKIKQGFFWALVYNALLLPIAAGLLFPLIGIALRPEFAGLAMALSSVSVVTNALLLGRYSPEVAVTPSSKPEPSIQKQIKAIDPICKMEVNIATAQLYSDYKGKRYYFCSDHCKQRFDETPEHYENQDHTSSISG